jgi:hypothetical protein
VREGAQGSAFPCAVGLRLCEGGASPGGVNAVPEQRGCKSAPLSATERACLPGSDPRPCITASLFLGLPRRAPLACLPFSLLDVSTRLIAVDARGAGGKRWSIQGNRACSRPRVQGLHGGRSAHRVGGHRRHLPAFLSPPACLVLCCFVSVCLSVCLSAYLRTDPAPPQPPGSPTQLARAARWGWGAPFCACSVAGRRCGEGCSGV